MSTETRSSSLRRPRLARKLSRRLSLVTGLIGAKLRQELGSVKDLSLPKQPVKLHLPVIAPDSTQRFVSGEEGCLVKDCLCPLLSELSVETPRLVLAGSRIEVDPESTLGLLQGEVLVLEDATYHPSKLAQMDGGYRVTEQLTLSEEEYCCWLRAGAQLYGKPLLKLDCISAIEYAEAFLPLHALAAASARLIHKLKNVLENWDKEKNNLGGVFDEKLWENYDIYQDSYKLARQLLRSKAREDEDFDELCAIRRGAAKLSLKDIFQQPVKRLAQYEQYFDTLFHEAPHLDHEQLQYPRHAVKQAVRRGQAESDLERIQDLFPNDALNLYDKDVLTSRMKGALRKGGRAGRLQRALSAKSLRLESPPRSPPRPLPPHSRHFVMEAPVHFTTGRVSQERHLFLFSDLLVVAKARPGGNFKLKQSVRVSEMWMTKNCPQEVAQTTRSPDTSFLIGWPTLNLHVSFSTQAARDLWWSKLCEVVHVEKCKEPRSTNIQISYVDPLTSVQYCKTFAVRAEDTVRGCIKTAVEHLEGGGGGGGLGGDGWKLWVKTGRDEAAVPLVGHERPFAIKLSCLRDSLSTDEGFDLDHCNNLHDPLANCHFILRNNWKVSEGEKKNGKKASRMKIGQVLRRRVKESGSLFGLALSEICEDDRPPAVIMNMLREVSAKGPYTQGIFRRSANARLVRELRDTLDRGEPVAWQQVPVVVTGAVLKDLLRSLPDPVLCSSLYQDWVAAMDLPSLHQRLRALNSVYEKLPKVNQWVVYQFVWVLWRVSQRAEENLMSAGNLAVCVGPSLLWSECPAQDLRVVPPLLQTLILHCGAVLSPPTLTLDTRDSGTDESDSLRRDDSSIESLECSPPPRKDKMSLSRDSGLTMSDSQLYTPDEEESGSTSSSGYDPAFHPHTKVSGSVSAGGGGEYVRVYGGWEERKNPNFQRQAWFRQRWGAGGSSGGASPRGKAESPRRSASDESLLEAPTPPPRRPSAHTHLSPPPTITHHNNLHVYSLQSEVMNTAAVTCEVISEPRRRQYRDTLYSTVSKSSEYPKQCGRLEGSITDAGEGCMVEEDSSTLSDDDCTPHVSRSNSRGHEVKALCHLPPVHVEVGVVRARSRSHGPASRSRSLPPPLARRAPITTYYLGQSYVTTPYDQHSYV